MGYRYSSQRFASPKDPKTALQSSNAVVEGGKLLCSSTAATTEPKRFSCRSRSLAVDIQAGKHATHVKSHRTNEMNFQSQVSVHVPSTTTALSLRLTTPRLASSVIFRRSPHRIVTITEPLKNVPPSSYFRLSALPPEVRSGIYVHMIALPRRDHLNFLLSCRSIFNESSQSFFRRPLRCSSQAKLIDFTGKQSAENLAQVQTLAVQLVNIDADRMESIGARIVLKGQYDNPYDAERDRIIMALQKLPSLTHVVFLKPRHSTGSIPSKQMNEILAFLGMHLKLQSLGLDIDTFSIQNLASFTNLKSLEVSGFGRATPKRILDSLKDMHLLCTLQLVGPPIGTKWRQYFKSPNAVSFVTPAAIQQLPVLRALEIFELVDVQSSKPALLHTDMLKAVCRTNAHSLEDLCISSTAHPDFTTVAFIIGLLITASRLYRVNLMWPNMSLNLLDSLPETVRYLRLAASGRDQAEIFLSRLSTMRHKLPFLRTVELLVINEEVVMPFRAPDQRAGQKLSFGLPLAPPVSMASWLQLEVRWCIWQPVPPE